MTFQSEASKLEFLSRLDGVKRRLFPTCGSVDNYQLLTGLLDLLDGGSSGAAVQQEESASPSTVVQPMLDSSGWSYIGLAIIWPFLFYSVSILASSLGIIG